MGEDKTNKGTVEECQDVTIDYGHMKDQIHIFHFSGTGNARKAADWIAEESRNQGWESHLHNLNKTAREVPEPLPTDTLIGFTYPTHGFNAPPLVLKYLSKFPRGRNRVFLLNTRAGMKLSKQHLPGIGGMALWIPFLILWWKGYKVRGFRPLDMPSNWISLHPGLRSVVVASIHQHCHHTLILFTRRFLQGKTEWAGLRWLPIDLPLIPITFLYYVFGRFFLAKTFIASDKCTQCNKCVHDCPVQAISYVNGRPYWKFRCESCMQCMNHCPERAIETAHGFSLLLWWIIFSILPAAVYAYVFNNPLRQWVLSSSFASSLTYWFNIALGLIIAWIAYHLLHWCLRYRTMQQIILFTSLTHFLFWRRYRADGKSV